MLNAALKLIAKIEEHGFEAYIVGGFVRDYVLGIESSDVDVCTSARPVDIKNIFKNACLPNEAYGSITVIIKNVRFEITTFRKEITYVDNRKPVEIEFIDDLEQDLVRRDFLINTLCMNSKGEVLDLLGGKRDLEKREINTVGDSYLKFSEDALRILRAVRFATFLDFRLSADVKESIIKTKHLLRNLSFDRKKNEVNKIFASKNVRYGVKLLLELGLDKELKLKNLRDVKNFDDLMGIWAQLDIEEANYPFTKNEKSMIDQIKIVMKLDNLDSFNLYKYGLYVNTVAAEIKGIDRKRVTLQYQKLPIKSKNEIHINGVDIINILGKTPGKYVKEIIMDLEEKVLSGKLVNDYDTLVKYVEREYANN